MLRANYSRNIAAAKNSKKKWWERKEGSLKGKKKAGNDKPVICVTLGLCAVLREREGKISSGLWTTKVPNSEKVKDTEDPKMLQDDLWVMCKISGKIRKGFSPCLSQMRAQLKETTLIPCSCPALKAQPGQSTGTRLFYFRLVYFRDFSKRTVSLQKSPRAMEPREEQQSVLPASQSSWWTILLSCVICTCVFLSYYFLANPIIKRLEATSTAHILLCPSIPKLWLVIRWPKQGQTPHLFGSGKSMNGGNSQHPLPSTKPG